jgi:type III secretion protein N (ATPase)
MSAPLDAAAPVGLVQALARAIARAPTLHPVGRIVAASGTLIRVSGVQARIGELCVLRDAHGRAALEAEVVGLANAQLLLTPLGALRGLAPDAEVVATGRPAEVGVGEALLGRIVDANGAPLDGGGAIAAARTAPIHAAPPSPLARAPVARRLTTGVRAIDALLTCGEGQRLGVFATAGGGKSTLAGMLARGSDADVNVIALIGERGREVREFVDDNLGAARRRSVVVVATSDRPALERQKAAYVATAIAEHFRACGRRVLFLLDSVTRFARALRDVGLAVGEPPARRGYPPSVFSALPALFERAGNDGAGSITGFYTVLVEDEDVADPIAEEVRSTLDGHIVLARRLAQANHYPAIDVAASVSRLMPRLVDAEHRAAAGRIRRLVAKHRDLELVLALGEHKPGGDPEADDAIARSAAIGALLRQDPTHRAQWEDTVNAMRETLR